MNVSKDGNKMQLHSEATFSFWPQRRWEDMKLNTYRNIQNNITRMLGRKYQTFE